MAFISRSHNEPVGSVKSFANSTLPVGYLPCDGTLLVNGVNTYPELFAKIGFTFGGSGSDFRVPDLRGRAPIGDGTGAGLTARTRGQTVGVETVALTEAQMPGHTHTFTNQVNVRGRDGAGGSGFIADGASNINYGWLNSPNTSGNNGTPGNGQAHDNMSPALVVKFGIKF